MTPQEWSENQYGLRRHSGVSILRLDGVDLCREGPLWLGRSDREPGEIGQSTRIGITRDVHRLLRFYLRGSPFVSGPRLLTE